MAQNAFIPGTSTLEQFFGWINERHMIYLKRFVLKEPKPWTQDKILREYKFTNAFRELDRGTLALRRMEHGAVASWRESQDWNAAELIVFNTFWYRLFNL